MSDKGQLPPGRDSNKFTDLNQGLKKLGEIVKIQAEDRRQERLERQKDRELEELSIREGSKIADKSIDANKEVALAEIGQESKTMLIRIGFSFAAGVTVLATVVILYAMGSEQLATLILTNGITGFGAFFAGKSFKSKGSPQAPPQTPEAN